MTGQFILDTRLEQDCLFVKDLEVSRVMLLNDSRWPWLVLMPRIPGIEEIHQLDPDIQLNLSEEISQVSKLLQRETGCEKINIGALGNIVRQLHIHIIARNTGDANWPGPVWGYGSKIPYSSEDQRHLISSIKGFLP